VRDKPGWYTGVGTLLVRKGVNILVQIVRKDTGVGGKTRGGGKGKR